MKRYPAWYQWWGGGGGGGGVKASDMKDLTFGGIKGLLHCFSTCIEITGNNWY